MKKLRTILLIFLGLAALVGIILFVIGALNPAGAGIQIETNPASTVFINGEQLGRTPFQTVRKPGEVVIRLIPDSFDKPLSPYETKITLVSGVETVVRRDFGELDESSAGEVVSFEKTNKGEVSLAVVTTPDSAQISIDGQIKGFAPYKTSSISEGDHRLTISAKGYTERKMDIKTVSGYRLTALVNLSPSGEAVVTPDADQMEEEPTPTPGPMVEILDTGTGFLRVRSEPSTLGAEVGQVKPGETYEIVSTDEKTGWFEIEYEKGKTGWISSQYAKEVSGSTSEGATPTPTLRITVTQRTSPTPTPR